MTYSRLNAAQCSAVVLPVLFASYAAGAAAGRSDPEVDATSGAIESPAAAPRVEEAERLETIAIVATEADAFAARLVVEIESLGFRTARVAWRGDTAISRRALEQAAGDVDAIAAIWATFAAGRVEVWIADRVTGKTLVREVGFRGSSAELGVVAVRIVELLRASLLELTLPAPAPGEVPVTSDIRDKAGVPAAAPAASPTLRIAVVPSVLWSPGGLGAAWLIDLALTWMAVDHLGLRGFVALPFVRSEIERPAGRARVSFVLAGVAASLVPTEPATRWTPSLDLGVTTLTLLTTATPETPFVARDSSAFTGAPFARVALAFAPVASVRLRVDALVGVVLTRVSVRFARQRVASWGQPFFLVGLGSDFGW